ncbi:uncharacterized protein LY79DRAFT_562582 [Colletotrichum navitas]|uniref:Uncharacterized protein n=1 Tax=Colletotrichum navitas TaxID=681940 RepID=A0AAD8PTX4_9PEZI|nr:uncharacterized protein LY79DRAFT_562582 [Colletotrichum navitas]KAK1580019.1 hypothetical protein LY79DRAFT_562582 [Colletotrichum navitas]
MCRSRDVAREPVWNNAVVLSMAICRTVCACAATVSQSPYFLGGICFHGWMVVRGYLSLSDARRASL